MKAAYIEEFAPFGNVKIGQILKPEPKEDEICIQVAFAGVNPADAKIAEGLFQSRMPHQFPLILGWDAAGTVHSVGRQVTGWKTGDLVYTYARKPILQWGTWAEYLTVPAHHVASKPKNLSMAQAAAIPLASLTAWQALFEKAHLQPKQQILIHGGGGSVGGFAIQWAKWHGAQVISTASGSKIDYVKGLGADEVIDYQKVNFTQAIKQVHAAGIDVVLDTIGGSSYEQSFAVLKPGGCIVSILQQPNLELSKKTGVRAEYLFVHPDGKQLEKITQLFENGTAKPPVIQEIPLDQANQALALIKTGKTHGKIVLKL